MNEERKKTIKVMLVDDHSIVREGVRSYLATQPHIEVVGEAADGREALRQAQALAPDVVLMDISLPLINGIATTRSLCRVVPKARVLVLTVHDNKEYVRQVIQSGARGYLLKDASPADLIRAIETVADGKLFFSPPVSETLLTDYVEQKAALKKSRVVELSIREREVLALIAEGHSNKEAAAVLGVGVRTVETHRERIMSKLDVHTVAGLTKFAIRHGIVILE